MQRLTVTQYAKLSGVSRQSIYGKINRGSLQCIMIDNVQYIEVDDNVNLQDNEQDKTTFKPVKTTINKPILADNSSYYLEQIEELKLEIKELKEELRQERKANKKLNKLLNKEKDTSIDILSKFIGEMKQLSYSKPITDTEIVEKKKKKK